MNCAQFQQILPEVIDGDRNAEQQAHLRSCPVCSSLMADLNLIVAEAPGLQELAEPSPRVWNSIEIALRQEGLIREPMAASLLQPAGRRWSLAWLTPVAALALLAFGVFVYQRGAHERQQVAQQLPAATSATVIKVQTGHNPKPVNNEDQQLLEAVGSRAPTMQAAYASNLENVNAYIRDAEESAQADPNDEEAQQVVMDAYEQRATIYEMALDRSLP